MLNTRFAKTISSAYNLSHTRWSNLVNAQGDHHTSQRKQTPSTACLNKESLASTLFSGIQPHSGIKPHRSSLGFNKQCIQHSVGSNHTLSYQVILTSQKKHCKHYTVDKSHIAFKQCIYQQLAQQCSRRTYKSTTTSRFQTAQKATGLALPFLSSGQYILM